MKPYKIINDSMLNMLNHIEENSIDCVITDPPYGLTSITKRFGKEGSAPAKEGKDGSFARLSKGFMGKEWDGSGIEYNVDAWRKCFSALKDGGYLLAFGGTRTFHRIACAIEDAGFEIRDTIMYIYGSGFPKSFNIGLAVDKLNGVESKVIGSQTKGSSPLSNNHNGTWSDNQKDGTFDIKQAQNEWQGWGTALKPSYEPIIVARKPMKTSVAENVLKNRVGGINIDECRVGDDGGVKKVNIEKNSQSKNCGFGCNGKLEELNKGRFPSNVITDGSEEVAQGMPFTNGGSRIITNKEVNRKGLTSENPVFNSTNCGFKTNIKNDSISSYGDNGSAMRYFYCAKTSKKDRDEGLDTLEAVEIRGGGGRVNNGYDVGNEEEKRLKEAARMYGAVKTLRKNTHPTVKPCELMQYLVRLVAPKGATILDPFMGSGSTGKAVMFENRERNADYKFIGIDLEKEYCAIAEMRIDYALNKYEYDFKQELQKSKEKGQISLFNVLEE